MTQLAILEKATLNDVLPLTGKGVQIPWRLESPRVSIQASIKTALGGAVSATVAIDVSNDGRLYKKDMMVFTLTGTGEDTDIDFMDVPYEFARARVTAMTGAGAEVFVTARV